MSPPTEEIIQKGEGGALQIGEGMITDGKEIGLLLYKMSTELVAYPTVLKVQGEPHVSLD